jgi:hypothetical protein
MVTGIQHLQTPISSFMAQKMNFHRVKTIQLVIQSTCTQQIKDAHALAPVENGGKAHTRWMRDCVCKKLWTPENDAFMILVSLPPTSG